MSAIEVNIADYMSHLSVERGLSENTLNSYRRDLSRYQTFLTEVGRKTPQAITETDIVDFGSYLKTGDENHPALGKSSVARALVTVRGFHKFLLRERTVTLDVSKAVKPPRPDARLPKALSVDEVERILAAASAPNPPLSVRDRALLEVLYGTGARISETVGLDIDDIDFEQAAVKLTGKGSKQRIVPLGKYAIEALRNYLDESRPLFVTGGADHSAVFLNSRGGRLSRQSAWAVLTKAAADAEVSSEVSPHVLRHSYATHLLEGGADVRVVQELLGHASVTTTQIYTMVTIDRLRETYATSHPRARH